MSGNTQVISSILRNSVDSTGQKDLTCEGVPIKADGNLNYGNSGMNELQESDLENDRSLKGRVKTLIVVYKFKVVNPAGSMSVLNSAVRNLTVVNTQT